MLQSEATQIDERKSMGTLNLVKQHRSRVWLVHTGWDGGAYCTGKRISLKHTRASAEIKSASPA